MCRRRRQQDTAGAVRRGHPRRPPARARRSAALGPRRQSRPARYGAHSDESAARSARAATTWSAYSMSVIDPTQMTTTTTRHALTPLLLAVLALLSAFTPLSIDMYLPALPVIAVDLHGSVGDIQLTLSAFMIAFGA